MAKAPTYKEAFEELQQIVDEMENGSIDVDDLLEKVARASVLIKVCKEKLYATEDNVKKVLALLDAETEKKSDEEDDDSESPAEE